MRLPPFDKSLDLTALVGTEGKRGSKGARVATVTTLRKDSDCSSIDRGDALLAFTIVVSGCALSTSPG